MIANTGLLTKGLRSEFFERFGPDDATAAYRRLCSRIPSSAAQEAQRWLGYMPTMRAWGTGRKARGLNANGMTLTNEKFELTLEVDRDEIDDDQTGQIRLRIQDMAPAAAAHKDIVIEDLLNHGADAGYTCYDGQRFFSATHSEGASGNQSNLTTPAMAAAAPTVVEFRAGVDAARATMTSYLNDQGESARIRPSGLAVVVPPALEITAIEAMTAAVLVGSTVTSRLTADVIMLPGLSSAVTGFLCKLDSPVGPFVWQDRAPIEFGALDSPTSEEGFKREKYLYGVRARYKIWYGRWTHCIRMVFT